LVRGSLFLPETDSGFNYHYLFIAVINHAPEAQTANYPSATQLGAQTAG